MLAQSENTKAGSHRIAVSMESNDLASGNPYSRAGSRAKLVRSSQAEIIEKMKQFLGRNDRRSHFDC
jgi:hypothetical protein